MVSGGLQVQQQTMLMVQTACLSGLDVEKKRGEDVPPMTRRVAQMAHGWRKF